MSNIAEYRGKELAENQWVYGIIPLEEELPFAFNRQPNSVLKCNGEITYIDPQTCGKYTKQKDDFGKKIYDGDILGIYGHEEYGYGAVFMTENQEHAVLYQENTMSLSQFFTDFYDQLIKVVGNIFDNEELLSNVE